MNVTTITVSTDQSCAVPEQENINMFIPQREETVCVEESPLTIVIPQGIPGADGQDGQGVPPGGNAGQILAKIDGTNYNTEWIDAPDATFQESVTYAQLVALIGASTLIPGLQYLISDFRSAWYHLDGGAPINSPNYAAVEPIVVTAITSNKIASLAYSTVHQSDVLYYDWNAANWTADAFYSIGGTIIPGWRGVITRRIDTVNNTNCTFDSRAMTFRRWAVNTSIYNAGATYNRGDFVRFGGSNACYFCIEDGVSGVSPTSDFSKWCKFLEGENVVSRPYYLCSSLGHDFDFPLQDDFWTFNIPASGYSDFLAFPLGSQRIFIEGPDNYSASNVVLLTNSVGFSSSIVRDSTIGNSSGGGIGVESDTVFCRRLVNCAIPPYSSKIVGGELLLRFTNTVFNAILPNSTGEVGFMFVVAVSDSFNGGRILGAQTSFVQRLTFSSTGFGFNNNKINTLSNCALGDYFDFNTAATIQDSTFGNSCQYNAFNDIVDRCIFGNNAGFNTFNSNVQGVVIKDNFINNTSNGPISDSSFGYNCEGNAIDRLVTTQIGDGFIGNTGVFFIDSQIDSGFQNNTFANMVQYLKGGGGFTGADYSASTIVYGAYTKVFSTADGGSKVVQYIDASNTLVITNHDA